MAKITGTLDKYDQRRLWKCICIVYPFYILLNESNFSLDKNFKCNLKFYEMFFSLIHIGHN